VQKKYRIACESECENLLPDCNANYLHQIRSRPRGTVRSFYSEWWQFGAPFRIKLRTHTLLKLLYKFSIPDPNASLQYPFVIPGQLHD
jgi:hypothetical protein